MIVGESGLPSTSKQRFDPRAQLPRTERLRHEVVGASIEPLKSVDLFAQGGEHDDVRGADCPYATGGLEAVHTRHVDVECRDNGGVAAHSLDAVLRVSRGDDLEAPLGQYSLQQVPDVVVILDDNGYARLF